MNIHEYQAKELLAKYGIGIPAGHAALTVEEAVAGAKQRPGPLYVVTAQIHAGGRGKGKFKELGPDAKGGVRLAKSIEDVEASAREKLGNTLVTIQTGDEGKQVNRLYVTDGVDIASEYYLSMLVDRASGRVAMIVSTEGGMDIEEVAHDTPEKITTITIDPAQGFMPHHGRAVAFGRDAGFLRGERRCERQHENGDCTKTHDGPPPRGRFRIRARRVPVKRPARSPLDPIPAEREGWRAVWTLTASPRHLTLT